MGDATFIDGAATDILSIDDDSDTDFLSFTLSSPLDVTLTLKPKGATYQIGPDSSTQSLFDSRSMSDLSLALFDTNGTTQLGPTANANGAGQSELISRQLNPGTYYLLIRAPRTTFNSTNWRSTAARPIRRP